MADSRGRSGASAFTGRPADQSQRGRPMSFAEIRSRQLIGQHEAGNLLAQRLGESRAIRQAAHEDLYDRRTQMQTRGLRQDITKENLAADLREAQQRGRPIDLGLGQYFGSINAQLSGLQGLYGRAASELEGTTGALNQLESLSGQMQSEFQRYNEETTGLRGTALANVQAELSQRTGLMGQLGGQVGEGRISEAVGRAGADVNAQIAQARQQMTEEARAQGIDPTSPAFQARMDRLASQGALSRVQARERGRRTAEEDLFQRRSQLAQMSTGAPGLAAASTIDQGSQARMAQLAGLGTTRANLGMQRAQAFGQLAGSQAQAATAGINAMANIANTGIRAAQAGVSPAWPVGISSGAKPTKARKPVFSGGLTSSKMSFG